MEMDEDTGDTVFRLYVNTENDAFHGTNRREAVASEIARILRFVAIQIEREGVDFYSRTVWDVNGNDVGRYALKTLQQWNQRKRGAT